MLLNDTGHVEDCNRRVERVSSGFQHMQPSSCFQRMLRGNHAVRAHYQGSPGWACDLLWILRKTGYGEHHDEY